MDFIANQHIPLLPRPNRLWTGLATAWLICLAQGADAFLGTCSFNKTVKSGSTSFTISSTPAAGCLSQTVLIEALRSGKPAVRLISGLEYLPVDCWAADLDGDGNEELVMASNAMDNGIFGIIDVYYFDGSLLRKTTLPALSPEEQTGYRGMDTFKVENSLIVRTFPIRSSDDETLARRYRTLRYRFEHGVITPTSTGEQTANVPLPEPSLAMAKAADTTGPAMTPAPAAVSTMATQPVPAPNRSADLPDAAAAKAGQGDKKPAGRKPAVGAITIGENYLEIRTGTPETAYRQLLLDNPPRLAIDIPDAGSTLKTDVVKIRKYGIDQARVGKNAGFIRIVLDAGLPSFPKFSITRTSSGLRIGFPR